MLELINLFMMLRLKKLKIIYTFDCISCLNYPQNREPVR